MVQSLRDFIQNFKLPIMKKIIFISCLFCMATLFSNCKKDETPDDKYKCATCKTTPDALAVNDGSSKGVYKGVVIGSSGTIEINILNGGTTITAVLVIDGTTINLTSTTTWVAGQQYTAPFTGTFNGSTVTVEFSVDASGEEPEIIASNIPGHPNASFVVVKESSKNLVESFEGTFRGSNQHSGIMNLIVIRSQYWLGIAQVTDVPDEDAEPLGGLIESDNKLMINMYNIATETVFGILSGDEVTGEFIDASGTTITLKCRRTR